MQDTSKCCPIVLESHDGAAQVLGLVCLVFSFEDNSHISPTQVAGVGNGTGVVDNLFYFPLIQQGSLQPRGVEALQRSENPIWIRVCDLVVKSCRNPKDPL